MEGNLTGDADAPLYHGLKACLDGEGDGEAAVRQLLPRIKHYVRKECPALGSEADAIAVLVIERVCERLDTFRDQSPFFLWVAGITRNVMQERFRNQTERAQSEALLTSLEGIVLDQMAHEVNCLVAEEALASLTDLQRTVLAYQHTTDMTSAQIGEKVDRSTNAVRQGLVDAHAAVAQWRKTKGY
jgi:RNA polymerase sigma factor (sigma-70 family)